MTESENDIPALKYDWVTQVYDQVLQFTMPEKNFKKALIAQMGIQPGNRVHDFGCGSLTLSIMTARGRRSELLQYHCGYGSTT